MTVTIDFWQLVGAIIALVIAFWIVSQVLFSQFEKHFDSRFAVLAVDRSTLSGLEKDILTLKAELPEKYVRREDYIRGQTVIEAKLDAISSELKVVQIQGAKRAN